MRGCNFLDLCPNCLLPFKNIYIFLSSIAKIDKSLFSFEFFRLIKLIIYSSYQFSVYLSCFSNFQFICRNRESCSFKMALDREVCIEETKFIYLGNSCTNLRHLALGAQGSKRRSPPGVSLRVTSSEAAGSGYSETGEPQLTA